MIFKINIKNILLIFILLILIKKDHSNTLYLEWYSINPKTFSTRPSISALFWAPA